jgi:pimeloyl-ACP methyl ester carboxylesterase
MAAGAGALCVPAWAGSTPDKAVDIGGDTALHYVDSGSGEPIVFVHGSLSDYDYWSDQLSEFAKHGRAIAYSRRYNTPNINPPISGYSAVTDAHDMAAFIERLRLAPAHVVGHSYGAFAALILATERPELVRTLTLAEPPAMSLLDHLPEPSTAAGKAMLRDVNMRMVKPMQVAFRGGRSEEGVRIFIDYVFGRAGTWDRMSPADKADTMKEAHEWQIMMTRGTLFPTVSPDRVRKVDHPTLILSGARSYPFLGLIDQALMALLPNRRRIVFPTAGHQMWYQEPQACRSAVLELIAGR